MLATIVKQPAEIRRETMPFPEPVTAIVSANCVARGLVPGAAALTAVAAASGGAAIATLTGGGDGERYLVTVIARTAAGAELESEIEVAVVQATWALPDGGAPYLSIGDFVERFGLDEVVRMTDADGTGRIDRGQLTRALGDAQAIADAHLAGRYALPLATVPGVVAMAIADIARNRLYPRGAPEGVAEAAKAATRLLERVQSGVMPLPIAGAAPVEAPSATPVLISPGRRQYPDGLDGY